MKTSNVFLEELIDITLLKRIKIVIEVLFGKALDRHFSRKHLQSKTLKLIIIINVITTTNKKIHTEIRSNNS